MKGKGAKPKGIQEEDRKVGEARECNVTEPKSEVTFREAEMV